MNLGNACYHSVQKLLSSDLMSESIKVKILTYKNYMGLDSMDSNITRQPVEKSEV
jgi:hypothetical protein